VAFIVAEDLKNNNYGLLEIIDEAILSVPLPLSLIFKVLFRCFQDQVHDENILRKQNGRLKKPESQSFLGDGGFPFYTMSQKMSREKTYSSIATFI
jgi:hypothetical protein